MNYEISNKNYIFVILEKGMDKERTHRRLPTTPMSGSGTALSKSHSKSNRFDRIIGMIHVVFKIIHIYFYFIACSEL